MVLAGCAVAASLGLASSSQATPVTYLFTGGSATLSATSSFGSIGLAAIPLTGTEVTFDSAVPSIISFEFTAGPTGALPLSGILSGISVTLASLTIEPGSGFSSVVSPPVGMTYNYTASNIAVSGVASLSGAVSLPPTAFSSNNPFLAGQIQLGSGTLALNGITLGVINVPAIGPFPGGPITLKADVLFTGVVPEPGTGLLLGAGVAALAGARRRARV